MLAPIDYEEYHLAHPPAFHLIDVPKTWLGVCPQGQDSASPRLPVHMGGLAGGLSLTSRVGSCSDVQGAWVSTRIVESAIEDL